MTILNSIAKRILKTLHHYSHALEIRSDLSLEYLRLRSANPSYPRKLLKKIWAQPQNMEDIIQLSRFMDVDHQILLLDVGANTGYWAQAFVDVFRRTNMFAFEPDRRAAELYKQRFSESNDSKLFDYALSDRSGAASLQLAKTTTFSSLEGYVEDRGGGIVGSIEVAIKRLDDIEIDFSGVDKVFLKIDVQGHELEVINGAQDTLKYVDIILLELSFAPEYVGKNPAFSAVTSQLLQSGHYPIIFQNYGRDRSPFAVQRDVIFVKEDLLCNIYGW